MKYRYLCCLILLLVLSSCNVKKQNKITGTEQIVNKLLPQINDYKKLEKVKERVVKGLFFKNQKPYEEAIIYCFRDDSRANMLAVIKTKDRKTVSDCLHDFLVEKKRKMIKYYPNEVFKVSNAIMSETNDYLILVIDDNIELMQQKVNDCLTALNKEKK